MSVLSMIQNVITLMKGSVYTTAFLKLFLVMYAGMATPKAPKFIVELFKHTVFKIFILMLVLITSNFDVGLSLMIAVAFFVTMTTLHKYHTISKLMKYPTKIVDDAVSDMKSIGSDIKSIGSDAKSDISGSTHKVITGYIEPAYEKIEEAVF